MPVSWKSLSLEERDEFRSLMSEALNGSRQPDASAVARAMDAMEAADRAGRMAGRSEASSDPSTPPKPTQAHRLKRSRWSGRLQRSIRTEDSQTVGSKRRIDGTTHRQQSLWTDMTWEEFEGWSAMNDARR